MGVMRTRRRLGVILHREQRQIAMAHTFECLVVQVNVRQFDFGLRQRVGVDGEVVVVGCDLDFAGVELLHRMVAAVMSEFQFESLAAERDAGQLVPETNSEDGLASHEAADVIDGVGARLGVAGAVGEENPVGLEGENVFGGGLRRDNRDLAGLTA